MVLAAGAGSRMGGVAKPLITRDGEALLMRQLRLLGENDVQRVVVVLGYYAMRISAVLEQTRWSTPQSQVARLALDWTINPQPEEGTVSSLRCGLRRLGPDISEVVVLLADQPLLQANDIAAVLAAWDARAPQIQLVLPAHNGTPGHPLVFDAALREVILSGQTIPRWRREHADAVHRLHADHGRYTTDLDTLEDVQRMRRRYAVDLVLPD